MKAVYKHVSLTPLTAHSITHRVNTRNHRKVTRHICFRRQEEAAPLTCSQVDHRGIRLLCIHAIHFRDGHVVALNPEVLAIDRANVDEPKGVRSVWLYMYPRIDCLIEQC